MKTTGPVLIVCFARSFGGADVRVLQTARWLSAQAISYCVAVLEGTELHRRLADEGLHLRAFDRRRGDPRLALGLIALARENGARVIDAHNMQSQYWAALTAQFFDFPFRVATVHSVYRQTHPGPAKRRIHEGALHLCARAGFRYIAVNYVVDAYLRQHFARASDQVILSQNGLEPLATPPQAQDLRRAAGWPAGGLVLGTIGRLETVKGHRHLFAALHRLKRDGINDLCLYVAGTGRDEAGLHAQVRDLGLQDLVYFAKFQTDIPSILAGLDMLCQPSDSEALPYALLEACRQAVPVVASDLPAITSVLKDGETGFIFRKGDADSLARRLRKVRSDGTLRRSVGEAAQRMVLEQFSIERMMKGTLAAYRGETPSG
jgi:glycosyltransferase involved in cell wall biosynthesis